MDDRSWILPTTLAVVILIPIFVIAAYLVRDRMKAQSDRAYKSLAEHEFLIILATAKRG